MTTLTPEKEAAERLETALNAEHHPQSWPKVIVHADDIRTVLAALSTERQARADSEEYLEGVEQQLKDANVAVQAAEKEVERLRPVADNEQRLRIELSYQGDVLETRDEAVAARKAAEAKLAALVHTLERIRDATPNNTNSRSAESMASWTHAVAACALSALPPPEGQRLAFNPFGTGLSEPRLTTEQMDAVVANLPTQAPQDVAPCPFHGTAPDPCCPECPAPPITIRTYSMPRDTQDVAGLVEDIAKIIDPYAFLHFDRTGAEENSYPELRKEALAKANRILSALRPSPISHESKALVLAAADNNRELVERSGFYVASRASLPERGEMWRHLRSVGAQINSSWIDEDGPGETADFADLWPRIEREIARSKSMVVYLEPDDFPLRGVFVEVGMALAHGVPVVIVAPEVTLEGRSMRPLGSWIKHPLVSFSDSVISAFQSRQEGKQP